MKKEYESDWNIESSLSQYPTQEKDNLDRTLNFKEQTKSINDY